MRVPLGYNATLLLNENVVLNGTLVPLGNMAWPGPPQTMSPLFTQQDFDMSSVDVSANARITRSCSWLYYTSTNLTGDAGRPYKALWSFGPQTPEPMRQSLAGVLENASQQDLLELAISPAEFNAAVDAVAQQIGELDIVRLEIIVTISNWLGGSTSANASAWIQLDQAPQVVPVGSTSLQIFNREEVEFNMQTELRESFECSDASRYNRRITVDWEYSGSNTTGWVKLSEDGNFGSSCTAWRIEHFRRLPSALLNSALNRRRVITSERPLIFKVWTQVSWRIPRSCSLPFM